MAPHGQFTPADHSKGDANTVGGYRAVHGRPAAFEGPDGYAYSVEVMVEPADDAGAAWGGFLLFVRWARIGAAAPEGHLESDFLVRAATGSAAHDQLGAMPLADARRLLEQLIAERHGGRQPARRWWDAMNADQDA